MASEIERKFLLQTIPEDIIQQSQAVAIKQGYLVVGQHCELRVRSKGEQYFFTSKRGQGMVREEKEQEIDQVIFDLVWPFTEGRRLEKTRHLYTRNNLVYEFDLYTGDLADLRVLEVEFTSVEAAEGFEMPDFCIKEITNDSRYKNANLALKGRPKSA